MRSLVVFFVLCFTLLSEAEIVSQTALELQIQQKVYSVIKPIDDTAIVISNLSYKKTDLVLPGAGSSFYEMFSSSTDQVPYESIDSVQIRVISKLNPFPETLKNLINSSVKIEKTKIKFSFEQMDASLVDLSRKNQGEGIRNWLEPVAQQFSVIFKSMSQKFNIVGVLIMLSFLLATAIIYLLISSREKKSQSFWGQTVSRLIDGMSGFSGGTVPMPVPRAAASVQRKVESELSINSQIKDLSPMAVKMIISDCYWCEEDHYAAWMWSMLTSQQRETLLKQWSPAVQYIPYVVKLKPEYRQDHLNSCYLAAFDLSMISHEDLIEWIRRHPESWAMLSPMRQAHLKLSLKEKISLSSKASLVRELSPPQLQSVLRIFEVSVEVGDLSEVDEMSLFRSPDFVPVALRAQIPSLVWMALLPIEQRKNLLEEFAAHLLAEAWIGPQPVLDTIKKAISEKKLALLNGYIKTIVPSRNSEAMQICTLRALEIFNQTTAKEEPVNAQVV